MPSEQPKDEATKTPEPEQLSIESEFAMLQALVDAMKPIEALDSKTQMRMMRYFANRYKRMLPV